MKKLILITLVISMVFLVGCQEYQCKEGIKEGNYCVSEEVNEGYFEGSVELERYSRRYIPHLTNISEPKTVKIGEHSFCVYAEPEILKIENLSIVNGNDFEFDEDVYTIQNLKNSKNKIFVEFDYSIRWRRWIWDGSNPNNQECIKELEKVGAEIE